MNADVERRIVDLMRDALAVEPPGSDTDLFETGLLDSLGLVTLISELEHEFGFQLPPDELELDSFRTVKAIAALVARHTTAERTL
jgi:D-alanine--poly(phosphoribitol) ligase subunit 2